MYQHPDTDAASLLESDGFFFAKSEAVSDEADLGYVEFTL